MHDIIMQIKLFYKGFCDALCTCIHRWKLNDSFITPRPGSRYSLMGGNLHIAHLNKEEDVGIYQCMASNSFGTIVSREASLHVACNYIHSFFSCPDLPVVSLSGGWIWRLQFWKWKWILPKHCSWIWHLNQDLIWIFAVSNVGAIFTVNKRT